MLLAELLSGSMPAECGCLFHRVFVAWSHRSAGGVTGVFGGGFGFSRGVAGLVSPYDCLLVVDGDAKEEWSLLLLLFRVGVAAGLPSIRGMKLARISAVSVLGRTPREDVWLLLLLACPYRRGT